MQPLFIMRADTATVVIALIIFIIVAVRLRALRHIMLPHVSYIVHPYSMITS